MAPTADHGCAETTAPLNPLNPEIERTDPSREIGMALSDSHPKEKINLLPGHQWIQRSTDQIGGPARR